MESSYYKEQSSFLRDNFSLSVVEYEDEEESETAQSIGDLEPEVIIGELSEEEACHDEFSPSLDEAWPQFKFEPPDFEQQGLLIQHLSENTSDGCDNSDTDGTKKPNSKEKCPSCNKRCNNLKTHKCKPINTLPCDIWGKHILSAQSTLNLHKKLYIGEKFTCELCNQSFTTKKTYFAHQLMNHGVKPFTCEFCDKKFARKQMLDEHLRVHLDIRPFVCEICKKSFTRKAHLDLHKEGHFPQYKCELCSRVFTRNGQLKEHIRIHTGEKPFKCEACGKEYARKTRLKHHKCEGSEISQDAANELQSGADPNFVCEVCNKRFPSEEHLELHKDSHIPRFKCDICERLFTRKAQLVEHERTHSGDKPFKCETCGKDYTRKIRLKRHSCKPLNAAKKLKTDIDENMTHFILAE